MIIFWAIPTSFVQTLGNLREIAQYDCIPFKPLASSQQIHLTLFSLVLSWINDILDALGPGAEGLLNSYLPSLLLIILSSLVIPIFHYLSVEEVRFFSLPKFNC